MIRVLEHLVDPDNLSGKTAVVTGAKSGIGAETCYRLSEAGVRIVAIDRAYRSGVQPQGLNTLIGADVRQLRDLALPWADIIGAEQAVDILVNSAAISGRPGSLWEIDLANQAEVIETGARACLEVSATFIPFMREGGDIVNLGSFAGRDPYNNYTAYSMAKAAVLSLSAGLRRQVADQGIRVITVIPGPTATPLQFEHEPWPVLLHPGTVADLTVLTLSLSRSVCVEEIHVRAFGKGETPVDAGPVSRPWPSLPNREGMV